MVKCKIFETNLDAKILHSEKHFAETTKFLVWLIKTNILDMYTMYASFRKSEDYFRTRESSINNLCMTFNKWSKFD